MTAILRNVPKTFTFEEQRIEINEIALDLYNLRLGSLELTDFSVVKPNPAASGSGDVTYDNTTGEFTYTPPDLSNFITSIGDAIRDADFTTGGLMKTDGAGNYSVITDNSTDWNNAASWGDHKLAGYLKSNGTYWDTNTNAYESSTLDLIGNVTLTNIQSDHYLKWNGTAWVNTSITIPAAQVQVDWDQTDINHIEYIKNKPTLVVNINDLGDVDTTGITNGKILKSDSTGNWIIADDTNTDTTYGEFTGTAAGLVPTSTSNIVTKFLRSDGAWADPAYSDTNTTYQLDSSTANTNDVKITLLDNNSNSDSVTITKGNNITFDQVTTSGFRISATGGSGGGATDFTDLGDTPNSLTANKWIRVNSGGASLEFINGNLEDLNNFALTVGQGNVAETDQVVQWNGTTWTNATLDLPSELSDLTNVSNAVPSDGQVLKWDNGNQLWKPASDLTSSGTGISLTDISLSKLPASATPDLDWDDQTGTFEYTPFDTKFTKLSDTPSTLTAGKHLKVNAGGTALEYVDNTFTNLTDTPSSLTANKWLKVNATGTALEYTDAPSGGGGGANVTISDTEPSSPSTGDLWWASDEGQLKIYYDDGVGTPSVQWVDTGGAGGGTAGTDNYVTNASLTGTDLVLTRSGGLANITTDLSSLGGSGGATDKIEENDTSVECIDDGTGDRIEFKTSGTEAVQIDANSQILISGSQTGDNIAKIYNTTDGLSPSTGILGIFASSNNATPRDVRIYSGGGTANEIFRAGKNGQIGVDGGDVGTAGQVLTSGGPNASATWQTVTSSGGGSTSNTWVTYLNGQPRWSLQTAANSYSESISYQTASNTGPGGIDLTGLCDGNDGSYVNMGIGHANISYLWLSQANLTDVIKVTVGYDGDGWFSFGGNGANPTNYPVEGGGTYAGGISGSPTELVVWDSSSPAFSGQLRNFSFISYDDPNGNAPGGVIKGATSVCHVYYFKITRSVDNVLTEITYTAPGSGGGTTQDLQDVTDQGKTTTNDITAAGFTSDDDIIINYDSSASNSAGDIKFKDGSTVKLTISSKFESINSGTNWINRIKSDTVGSPLVMTGGKGAYNNSGAATVIGFSGGLMPDIPHLIGLDDDYNYLTELYGGGTKVFTTQVDGVQPIGALYDKDDEKGTAGQILSSTGTALDWIDPPTGGNGIVSANVKDFGALGNNSNDDTTAIQAAINSLLNGSVGDGGVVYLPPGVYRISAPLTFGSTAYSITLKGSTTHFPVGTFGGSIIRNTGSGNAIEITNSMSITITNLGIDHTSSSGGTAISATSTGSKQGITVDQVYILDHSKGIDLIGYANSIIRNTEIRDQPDDANSTHAILLKKGTDGRQDQLRLENVIVEGETPAGSGVPHSHSVGLKVEDWTNSIWVKDCAFLRMTQGIYYDQSVQGRIAEAGAFHRIENSDVDHCRANGMFFDGGYAIWVQNCYIGSNGYPSGSNQQSGLVTGENFRGTLWVNNADCRGNSKYGLAFNNNHTKIHINSCHCGDNGAAQPSSSAGIYAIDGANDITIIGGQCGGDNYGHHTNSSNQQNGIHFQGDNHQRININAVDTTCNAGPSIVFANSGLNIVSNSENFIQNCPGFNTGGQTSFP